MELTDWICLVECDICYTQYGTKRPDGLTESPIKLRKCKHVFGDLCLMQWLQTSAFCPYCRGSGSRDRDAGQYSTSQLGLSAMRMHALAAQYVQQNRAQSSGPARQRTDYIQDGATPGFRRGTAAALRERIGATRQ